MNTSRKALIVLSFALRLVLLSLVAVPSGCNRHGSNRVPVAGQVLIDGQPLDYGSIRFVPKGPGRPSFATIDKNGHFDFGDEGAVLGTNRVEVIGCEQLGATGYRWHAPEKYANYSSSGLEQEISGPTDDLKLTLTWNGGKPYTVQGPTDSESEEFEIGKVAVPRRC